HYKCDAAGGRKELLADERRLSRDCRELAGIFRALGADRERREKQTAADPEHDDDDVDELEDPEPRRARIGRLEGEEEADTDEREEDCRSDPSGLAVRSLDVRGGFHPAE